VGEGGGEMDKEKKKKAISELESLLERIPNLKQMLHHNKNYKPWDDTIRKILIDNFGNTSRQYLRYEGHRLAILIDNTHDEQQRAYIDWLNNREKVLEEIIKELKRSKFEIFWNYFIDFWQATIKAIAEGFGRSSR
jgi:glycosyltransferase involved in cell wall biosynthesis